MEPVALQTLLLYLVVQVAAEVHNRQLALLEIHHQLHLKEEMAHRLLQVKAKLEVMEQHLPLDMAGVVVEGLIRQLEQVLMALEVLAVTAVLEQPRLLLGHQ